jgi:GST-like protein
VRVFESGAILIYLAEKFGAFLPRRGAARECLSWLFWQMGSAPFLGGGFGHFYAYAPVKIEYAINRYAMEAKRQLDVLDRRLAESEYRRRRRLHDRRHGDLALVRRARRGELYEAAEFLQVQDYATSSAGPKPSGSAPPSSAAAWSTAPWATPRPSSTNATTPRLRRGGPLLVRRR